MIPSENVPLPLQPKPKKGLWAWLQMLIKWLSYSCLGRGARINFIKDMRDGEEGEAVTCNDSGIHPAGRAVPVQAVGCGSVGRWCTVGGVGRGRSIGEPTKVDVYVGQEGPKTILPFLHIYTFY